MTWNFYGVLFMPWVACSLNINNFGCCIVELCIYLFCMVGACMSYGCCYFLYRKIYFFKCYGNFMVTSYKHVVGAIIFIEFIMHFCYGFLYPPKYLNKLIKGFKKLFRCWHHTFWYSFDMCDELVKLALSNYMFATWVNN
jgi:hypothetical protein